MKHNWQKNDKGEIDKFAWSEGFHNGVFCEDCGHTECVLCNPNYDDDDSCPGPKPINTHRSACSHNKTIREIAYEKYKLSWMCSHGFTLSDLMRELHAYQEGDFILLPELFREWELEAGFSGSIWACFDEFLDAEYQDEEYMESLLTKSEFVRYLSDKNKEETV